jgi:hypothetical protein
LATTALTFLGYYNLKKRFCLVGRVTVPERDYNFKEEEDVMDYKFEDVLGLLTNISENVEKFSTEEGGASLDELKLENELLSNINASLINLSTSDTNENDPSMEFLNNTKTLTDNFQSERATFEDTTLSADKDIIPNGILPFSERVLSSNTADSKSELLLSNNSQGTHEAAKDSTNVQKKVEDQKAKSKKKGKN